MAKTLRLQDAAAAAQAIQTAQYLQHLAREGLVCVSHARAIIDDIVAATGGAPEAVEEAEAARRIIVCATPGCDLVAMEADESAYCREHRDQPRESENGYIRNRLRNLRDNITHLAAK